MVVRVAHVGTGHTGREALKRIIANPQLELVGLWVVSPEKVGCDAGDLVGLPACGVPAVAALDEALSNEPEVFCYCGNGLGREEEAAHDMAEALERGINVGTISLLSMLFPPAGPREIVQILEPAAAAGSATFVSTGLDPGFSSDVLPWNLLPLAGEIRSITLQEHGIYDHYDVEPVIRDVMGFGRTPDYRAPVTEGAFARYWAPMVRQLAERVGLILDDVVQRDEYATHDRVLKTSVGDMDAGTVVARRIRCEGMREGRAVIVAEHITRMSHEVAPHWPTFDGIGESNYRVLIAGDPEIRCDLDLGKANGVWGSVSATATRLTNLLPQLVHAPPGLVSAMDLPTGRYAHLFAN